MKLQLRGILTELGSNYETHDVAHSGAIIQCDGQNLHFALTSENVQRLGPHLFDVVDITLQFMARDERLRRLKLGNKPRKKKPRRRSAR